MGFLSFVFVRHAPLWDVWHGKGTLVQLGVYHLNWGMTCHMLSINTVKHWVFSSNHKEVWLEISFHPDHIISAWMNHDEPASSIILLPIYSRVMEMREVSCMVCSMCWASGRWHQNSQAGCGREGLLICLMPLMLMVHTDGTSFRAGHKEAFSCWATSVAYAAWFLVPLDLLDPWMRRQARIAKAIRHDKLYQVMTRWQSLSLFWQVQQTVFWHLLRSRRSFAWELGSIPEVLWFGVIWCRRLFETVRCQARWGKRLDVLQGPCCRDRRQLELIACSTVQHVFTCLWYFIILFTGFIQ